MCSKKKKKKKVNLRYGQVLFFTRKALLNEEDVQNVPVISWLREKKKIKEEKFSFYIKSSMLCYSLEAAAEGNNNNK